MRGIGAKTTELQGICYRLGDVGVDDSGLLDLLAAMSFAKRVPGLAGELCWCVGVGLMSADEAVEVILDESRRSRTYAAVDEGGVFEVQE
jgi:hypothetical protein